MDELLSGKKSSFFLLDSSIVAGHGISPFWLLNSILNGGFFFFFIMFTMAIQNIHPQQMHSQSTTVICGVTQEIVSVV